MVSYRYWFGTCKWDESDTVDMWNKVFQYNEKMTFLIGQLEEGTTETHYIHWQVVVHFKDKVGGVSCKKAMEVGGFKFFNSWHWKKSDSAAANDYVQKEESSLGYRFKYGSPPMKMNSKTEWDKVMTDARSGNWDEIPAGIMVRNYNNIKKIHADSQHAEKRIFVRKEHAKWYWGKTGVGKSVKAAEDFDGEEVYWKSGQDKWWGGYRGEAHIIIDDIGRKSIRIDRLLSWVNWTPYRVEDKGTTFPLFGVRWIVTSNFHPRDIWTEPEDVEALAAICDRFEIIELVKPFYYATTLPNLTGDLRSAPLEYS